jgi:hypothetical protein
MCVCVCMYICIKVQRQGKINQKWWKVTLFERPFLGFSLFKHFFFPGFFPFRWDMQSLAGSTTCGSSSFTRDVNPSMVVNTRWCESWSKASWVANLLLPHNLGYTLSNKQALVKTTFYHITLVIHSRTSVGKNHRLSPYHRTHDIPMWKQTLAQSSSILKQGIKKNTLALPIDNMLCA